MAVNVLRIVLCWTIILYVRRMTLCCYHYYWQHIFILQLNNSPQLFTAKISNCQEREFKTKSSVQFINIINAVYKSEVSVV